ncbi:MAG: hypothetical protein AAGD07_17205, partial [Planctomycetota bacterium]
MINKVPASSSEPVGQSRTGYRRVIGIDVAKDKLDVFDSSGALTGCIDNDPKSIAAKLLASIEP